VFETPIKISCEHPIVEKWFPIYPANKRKEDLIKKFDLDIKTPKLEAHPKRCPGIMDIISYGYIVPSWCDMYFDIRNGEIVSFGTHARMPLNSDIWNKPTIKKTNENSHWCGGWVKIENPWYIKTTPDTKIIINKVPFRNDDIFESSEGLSESSWMPGMHIFLKLTKKDGSYVIPAGTPLFQFFPIKTGSFKLEFQKESLNDPEKSSESEVLGILRRYNKFKYKYSFK
jgi:hypothetical protein